MQRWVKIGVVLRNGKGIRDMEKGEVEVVFGRDDVNHPTYYTQGNIEVLDFILDQKMGYMEGNIIKYICRYRFKGGVEDLKKARFYLEKLISQKENKT